MAVKPSPFRLALALAVGYGLTIGIMRASMAILVMVLGWPPGGRLTTPYLAGNVAASFLAAVCGGYAASRLAPPDRRLVTVSLLMLIFLVATVVAFRTIPPEMPQDPPGYVPLVALLNVVGLWAGVMVERARYGTRRR